MTAHPVCSVMLRLRPGRSCFLTLRLVYRAVHVSKLKHASNPDERFVPSPTEVEGVVARASIEPKQPKQRDYNASETRTLPPRRMTPPHGPVPKLCSIEVVRVHHDWNRMLQACAVDVGVVPLPAFDGQGVVHVHPPDSMRHHDRLGGA